MFSLIIFLVYLYCFRQMTHFILSHSAGLTSNKSNKWSNQNQEIQPNVRNAGVRYGGRNYKPNMWYSNCSTWDSATGLVQIWFDGKPSFRKYIISGAITQTAILLLGQEQDSHGGGFNINQSFVGMMSDVHMWNYTLSPCEIQNYMNKGSFTPGNVLNWKALNFQINAPPRSCHTPLFSSRLSCWSLAALWCCSSAAGQRSIV
uniref:Pentraxin family member n=1 Tax=Oryzias latipes TaxID=8090 RepID=A0A3P9IEQ0_ORYLA